MLLVVLFTFWKSTLSQEVSMCYEDILQPNIVIFNADDMGYGDLSSYGHPTQEWNRVDDLSREGMRFTNMYAASSLCSPSRAGLLTGRLPRRIGMYGGIGVLLPNSTGGLPRQEITIAEALKDVGYTTGMVGKWHLGINSINHTDGSHLPYNHGFDYVGLNVPLSNTWECDDQKIHLKEPDPHFCALYDNATIIQQPFSLQGTLTSRMVANAKDFIKSTQKSENERPFFLYFALLQPHVALFNTRGFAGSSIRGRYGDDIGEMAWAVGEVMDEVKQLGIDSNTMVFFISDNGPQVNLCSEGGDAGPLKGSKGQSWEGGIRVPGIVRWPGRIKPGTVNHKVVSQLDLLPTIVSIAGGKIPTDRIMDGQDVSNVILNEDYDIYSVPDNKNLIFEKEQRKFAREPRFLPFYCQSTLYAIRYGSYKFHFYTQTPVTKTECGAGPGCDNGIPLKFNIDCLICGQCRTAYDPPLMYNLDEDPNEAYALNVTQARNKVVMEEMMVKLKEYESSLISTPGLLAHMTSEVHPCCTPETYPKCECDYLTKDNVNG